MREDEARKKIRELLATSDTANDNRLSHSGKSVRIRVIIGATLASLALALFAAVQLHPPSNAVSISASGNSIAANGPVVIHANTLTLQDAPPRSWGAVDADERERIRAEAFALFPATLLANGNRSWAQILNWMERKHNVHATNVRDVFRGQHETLPRFYARLLADKAAFKLALASLDAASLADGWGARPPPTAAARFAAWQEIAKPAIRQTLGSDADKFINELKRNDN